MGIAQKKTFQPAEKKNKFQKGPKKFEKPTNVKGNPVKKNQNKPNPNKNSESPKQNGQQKKPKHQQAVAAPANKNKAPAKTPAIDAKKAKIQNPPPTVKNNVEQKKKKPVPAKVPVEIETIPALTPAEAVLKAKSAAKDVKLDEEIEKEIVKTSSFNWSEATKTIVVNELVSETKLRHFVKNFVKLNKHEIESLKKVKGQERMELSSGAYRLEVVCMKIPKCSKHLGRVFLPHPVHTKDDEICLFVADAQRGRKFDDEPTVQAYEKKLAENNVNFVKKIITVSTLVKEYSSYEEKRRLMNQFDKFITEANVASIVQKKLTKIFMDALKTPIAVKNITQDDMERALTTILYKVVPDGHQISIQFGIKTQSTNELAANLHSILDQLKTSFPGGWNNIRGLRLSSTGPGYNTNYPIYHNFGSPNCVPVSTVQTHKEISSIKNRAILDLEGLGITKSGHVTKTEIKDENKSKKATKRSAPGASPEKPAVAVEITNGHVKVEENVSAKNAKKAKPQPAAEAKPIKIEEAVTKGTGNKQVKKNKGQAVITPQTPPQSPAGKKDKKNKKKQNKANK